LGITLNAHRCEVSGEWIECTPIPTDLDIDWASHEFGEDGEIIGDTIVIDYTITASEEEGLSDAYTAVAGENVRIVMELTDNGTSDIPRVYINHSVDLNVGKVVTWGTNLIEYYNENIIYNVNLYRFGSFHQVDYKEKPLYHNIITNFTKGDLLDTQKV
jgi:hypothetical protein